MRNTAALDVRLDWDEHSKRFKLTTTLQMQHGVSSHWYWVETTQPIEAPDATQIAEWIRSLLESRLPF